MGVRLWIRRAKRILAALFCLCVLGWSDADGQTAGGGGARAESITAAAMVGLAPAAPDYSQMSRVDELRWRCHALAARDLSYRFGGDDPAEGGMDCSATVQHILESMGIRNVPRTSFTQYKWLERKGTLKKIHFWNSPKRAYAKMRPGDLVFWGKTYRSGHKVSHVMIYLGRNPNTGRQYMFGARGSGVEGFHGAGVDVFEMDPNSKGKLVGYGSVPGINK